MALIKDALLNDDQQDLFTDSDLESDYATPSIQRVENDYNADALSMLEGLEAVRKRPGMYIGDTGLGGLHHLFKEIIDNSIDEVLAGYCTEIHVTLHADRSITITDNGRGIPVDVNKVSLASKW